MPAEDLDVQDRASPTTGTQLLERGGPDLLGVVQVTVREQEDIVAPFVQRLCTGNGLSLFRLGAREGDWHALMAIEPTGTGDDRRVPAPQVRRVP